MALMVFIVFVENSSPVRPWTINGQGPSVVPSSPPCHVHLVDYHFPIQAANENCQSLQVYMTWRKRMAQQRRPCPIYSPWPYW